MNWQIRKMFVHWSHCLTISYAFYIQTWNFSHLNFASSSFCFQLFGQEKKNETVGHCKKYFCSVMQNQRQTSEMRRCDGNSVKEEKKKKRDLQWVALKLNRRQCRTISVTDWRLGAWKRDQRGQPPPPPPLPPLLSPSVLPLPLLLRPSHRDGRSLPTAASSHHLLGFTHFWMIAANCSSVLLLHVNSTHTGHFFFPLITSEPQPLVLLSVSELHVYFSQAVYF